MTAESSRIALAALVIAAAVFDLRQRRIPNWLALAGLGVAFALAAWNGSWGQAALGMLLALGVYLPLYALRAMGAGDAKLMAAVGAFAGVRGWLIIFLLTAIVGGILAVVVILLRGRVAQTLGNVVTIAGELVRLRPPHKKNPEFDVRSDRATRLPHGCTIALGTLLYLAANGFRIL